MSILKWNRPQDQTFEAGLDRGVLYLESGEVIPWNGLINVEDSGSSEVREFYIDGQKFLSTVSARDWEGSLEAYTYPDEFSELMGVKELGDGLFADSQMPGRFNLSYRTMVTAPSFDEGVQHYKIHLLYRVMASFGGVSYSTLTSGGIDPSTFQFDLTAVPQRVPNARPTAHLILDTRKIDPLVRGTLEGMLYGNGARDPVFPTIEELIDLMALGDKVVVVDNGNRTWTATGSNKNVYMTNYELGLFQIDNVDATYLSSTVYEFGETTDKPVSALIPDSDGIPYYGQAVGETNLAADTDGTPYFSLGVRGLRLVEDTDGILYFETDD